MAAKKQQALYVVNYLGRDRFVWAASAAEARAAAARPRSAQAHDTPMQGVSTVPAPRAGGVGVARGAKRAASRP